MGRIRKHLPLGHEKQVRTFLNLSPNQPLPRCPGRSKEKAEQYVKAGDDSHMAVGHICDDCRCDRTAGEGTRGDLYGLGVDTGHHGTGYCVICERNRRKVHTERVWRDHVKQLQETGMATTTTDIERKVQADGNSAVQNIEVADAIQRVRDAIQRFEDLDALDETKWLTSKGGDEISDVERAELVMKKNRLMLEQARTLDQLAKTQFEFNREFHIPLDVLKVWAVKIMNLFQKYCVDRRDYDNAMRDFKKIMTETRNPNMMMAEHEASVEGMDNANKH